MGYCLLVVVKSVTKPKKTMEEDHLFISADEVRLTGCEGKKPEFFGRCRRVSGVANPSKLPKASTVHSLGRGGGVKGKTPCIVT